MARKPDAVESLEAAREALSVRPSESLRLLPPSSSLPPILRPERDFLYAEAFREMGFLAKSEKIYASVLSRVDAKEDPALCAEAALASAAVLRSLGRTVEARRRLRSAAKTGLAAYSDRILLEETLVDRAEGRHGASLKALRKMLARSLGRNDLSQAGFLLWAIGGAERLAGRLRESAASFERSLAICRRHRDASGAGYALFGLAGVSRIRGRLLDSAAHYREAGRFFEKTEDVFAKAYAHCGLANALRQLGRLAQAEEHYRRSEALYSSLGDEVDLAYVVWGRGRIREQRGDLASARTLLQKALAMFLRNKETRGVVLSEIALAQALYALGRVKEAEALNARALRRVRRAGLHTHLEIFT